MIGRYRIIDEIGRGGMGLVYRAIPESRESRPIWGRGDDRSRDGRARRGLAAPAVALKVLRPELTGDAEAIERLRIEAAALAAIDHPGVVALREHGRTAGGAPFLALELVEGETLGRRIAECGTLAVEDALALARRIAEALAAVHERGVVHRDLKPDNVFLVAGGAGVKLFDFGIAKLAAEPALRPADGMIVGSPAYMAPEQCVGAGDCDHRADLYALGCVLFEMLAGRSPYGFLSARAVLIAHVRGPVPDLARHAEVPAAVARLATDLLAKHPDRRPRDARAVIARIDELAWPGRLAVRGTGAHATLGPGGEP